MNEALLSTFRYFRSVAPGKLRTAATALEDARLYLSKGKGAKHARSPFAKPFPSVGWNSDNARGERLGFIEDFERCGLRHVGDVMAECGERNGYWNNGGRPSGWYTRHGNDVMNDGDGLAYGVVYQLPGKGGAARFVAGYETGENPGSPVIDFGKVYHAPTVYQFKQNGREYWCTDDNPRDMTEARDAARISDHMAAQMAEKAQEYDTAWQAGSYYSSKGEEIETLRKEALALLAERREAKRNAAMQYPAMCAKLREVISDIWESISTIRADRAELAEGDAQGYCFWDGDKTLRAAFNEGAGEEVLKV